MRISKYSKHRLPQNKTEHVPDRAHALGRQHLPKGIYVLKVENGGGVLTQKFVKL
jgi:hypothetical protein